MPAILLLPKHCSTYGRSSTRASTTTSRQLTPSSRRLPFEHRLATRPSRRVRIPVTAVRQARPVDPACPACSRTMWLSPDIEVNNAADAFDPLCCPRAVVYNNLQHGRRPDQQPWHHHPRGVNFNFYVKDTLSRRPCILPVQRFPRHRSGVRRSPSRRAGRRPLRQPGRTSSTTASSCGSLLTDTPGQPAVHELTDANNVRPVQLHRFISGPSSRPRAGCCRSPSATRSPRRPGFFLSAGREPTLSKPHYLEPPGLRLPADRLRRSGECF